MPVVSVKNSKIKPVSKQGVVINFRVKPEFKKAFKIAAATYEITQTELVYQAFEAWQKKK